MRVFYFPLFFWKRFFSFLPLPLGEGRVRAPFQPPSLNPYNYIPSSGPKLASEGELSAGYFILAKLVLRKSESGNPVWILDPQSLRRGRQVWNDIEDNISSVCCGAVC